MNIQIARKAKRTLMITVVHHIAVLIVMIIQIRLVHLPTREIPIPIRRRPREVPRAPTHPQHGLERDARADEVRRRRGVRPVAELPARHGRDVVGGVVGGAREVRGLGREVARVRHPGAVYERHVCRFLSICVRESFGLGR